MEYYSAIKQQNNTICGNMDATRDSHPKLCKSERQISYDITYMLNLKYGIDEPIDNRNKVTDTANRLMVAEGRGRGWDELGVWG